MRKRLANGVGRDGKEVGRDGKGRKVREGRGTDGMKMSVPFIPKLQLHHCQYITT